MDEHENARRRVFRKKAIVNGIEGGEVPRARHAIDIAFDDLRKRRARGFEAALELLQHQFALALKRLWFYLAAFRIKRRQAGQIDEAIGDGDGVRHPAFAITLQISRKRFNPHTFDHGRSSGVWLTDS